MKAALIPPKGYLGTAAKSDYHLALAQIEDPTYRDFYSKLTSKHYIILDNGAAEGNPVSDDDLLETADELSVDEIVVPDVMRDYGGTRDRFTDFMSKYEGRLSGTYCMAVVQGSTLGDAYRIMDFYKRGYEDVVLGVPRHWLETLDDKWARFRILNYIEGEFGHTNVHLLGTSKVWKDEVRQLAQEFPWVRGVDSSMPYNYAIAGEVLDNDEAEPTGRPEGYLTEAQEHPIDEDILNHNIDVYMEWASGTEGARS